MKTRKYKLVGQLLDESRKVELVITDSLLEIENTIAEYKEVYGEEIFFTVEVGSFPVYINPIVRIRLSRILTALSPLNKIIYSL